MKKFGEIILVVVVPWLIIFAGVFYYNSDFESGHSIKTNSLDKKAESIIDHSKFDALNKDFSSGTEVTAACLSCHNSRGQEFMKTQHWLWHKLDTTPSAGIQDLGKINLMNNFCIGSNSNEKLCSMCHAGYGYEDKSFDFTNPENIDCLVCHDATGTYKKSKPSKENNFRGAGWPDLSVDLKLVATHVGLPKSNNCGNCHFTGGGGNNVKHGDLEKALLLDHAGMAGQMDVHMSNTNSDKNLQCVDCHITENHNISGQLYSVSSSNANHVTCTQCHTDRPHKSQLLNNHYRRVACQTCHISEYAKVQPTTLVWDWSSATRLDSAGKPIGVTKLPDSTYVFDGKTYENVHVQYDSKHGTMVKKKNVVPEYVWFNGNANHHKLLDIIEDTASSLILNPLQGSYWDNIRPKDAENPSRIFPVKVTRGRQPFDTKNKILIQPKLYGEYKGSDALWTDLDWDASFAAGMEYTGLPYSGEYGFMKTESYWPLNHEVSTSNRALQCIDCHVRDEGRLQQLTGFYLPGRDTNLWLDRAGLAFILFIVFGVSIHGLIRIIKR